MLMIFECHRLMRHVSDTCEIEAGKEQYLLYLLRGIDTKYGYPTVPYRMVFRSRREHEFSN